MKVLYDKRFYEDIKVLKDLELKRRLEKLINKIEVANSLNDIPNLIKIKGSQNAFRVRLGDYRLGIFTDKSQVKLIRFLHRKEIYKYFPE